MYLLLYIGTLDLPIGTLKNKQNTKDRVQQAALLQCSGKRDMRHLCGLCEAPYVSHIRVQ